MDELNSSCLPALKYARTNKFLGVFNVILWLILSDSQSEYEFILIIIMEIKL